MTLNLLARLAPGQPTRSALVASQLAGLQAERHVVKLQRSLDVQTGIVREAHQRIDRLVASLSAELREHQDTRRQRDEARALIVHLRRADDEATGRIQYLEAELRDMERSRDAQAHIADGLRTELLALKTKKGRR